jgi:hypothetical protein
MIRPGELWRRKAITRIIRVTDVVHNGLGWWIEGQDVRTGRRGWISEEGLRKKYTRMEG